MDRLNMTIGKRIFEAMKARNFSEGELARRSGVPQPTIHRIVSGDVKSPRNDSIASIAKALSLDFTWLVTGKEAKKQSSNLTLNNPDTIEIPQFDIKASMGSGNFPPDYQQPVITITVDKDFFIRQGINVTQSSKLSIITGIGDSMEGTFNDGDPIVINHEARSLIADGIYVFTLGEKLYLKRLQILPNCVRMISDNAKYPPYDIKGEELQQLVIHGKALFVWNGKRI